MKKHKNETKPTLDLLRARVDYMPETGEFFWKEKVDPSLFKDQAGCNRWHGKFAGKPVSKVNRGYVVIVVTVDGKETYSLGHRVAWAFQTGNWPEHEVDHRDGDRSNNQWDNLRKATHQQNQWNKGRSNRNRSGFKGVHQHSQSGRWIAQIRAHGRTRHLGVFDTPEQAAIAYESASAVTHGEFSRNES